MPVRNNPYGLFNSSSSSERPAASTRCRGVLRFLRSRQRAQVRRVPQRQRQGEPRPQIANINTTNDVTLKRGVIGDLRFL
jgi:hypothetical protein